MEGSQKNPFLVMVKYFLTPFLTPPAPAPLPYEFCIF